MNKKTFLQNISYVFVGIIVAIGLSYVAHATSSFNDPTGSYPNGNTPTPLNVGVMDQVKQGGLAVNGFIANANAELDGNTYFGGILRPDTANLNNAINFGGIDIHGAAQNVSVAINGGLANTNTIASAPLANGAMSAVCSDANGKVVLCSATDICSNISGNQTTVPSGYVVNSDGTCTGASKRFYSQNINEKSYGPQWTDGTFNGGTEAVSNGELNYHLDYGDPGKPTGSMPLVAMFGLDNDYPYGWQINTIDSQGNPSYGIQGTGFSDTGTRLLQVGRAGTYTFKISSSGEAAIKGKFGSDNNYLGVDFYMKVHHQSSNTDEWIRLANTQPSSDYKTAGFLHEAWPVDGKDYPDFAEADYGAVNISTIPFNHGGSGTEWSYLPFNFSFNQAMPLKVGDTVNIYALIYGASLTGNGTGNKLVGSDNYSKSTANNFFWAFETPVGATTFDITEAQ